MSEWLTAVVTVIIGAIIGGFTNHLAVRMLFRPYRPWMLGRFRVPFTPGLIPRRREELGRQMGHLVEHYLLTPEGIKRALADGGIEEVIKDRLTGYLEEQLANERTLRDLLNRYAPAALADDGRLCPALREQLQERWEEWRRQWLGRVGEKRLRDVLPAGAAAACDRAAASLAELLLARLREYLRSPEGVEQIRTMLRGLLGGGMLGGVVGMFLADDKLVGRLLPQIDAWLDSPRLADQLSAVMRREADKWLDKRVQEVLEGIGEPQLDDWNRQVFAWLQEQSDRLLAKPLGELLGPLAERLRTEWIPRLAQWIVRMLAENLERLLRKLEITQIVARQVEGFPLKRVEEMIIGITGKEFRMITLLGYLLGGAIGLGQAVLNLLW
ncbi:DUF445 domain-containing protein [Brevibacillus marinus]|uniref:DUF445 domain-containing protein n=1 Tax=Brevibacillus marinus TaxID=2496837 RepID=UPI000F81AF22|nr:DUF445 family protein [Brevibacillus marinus]